MTERKVTSATDYQSITAPKSDEGELVDMPSGAVFRMRRADFDGLLVTGAVPQSLLNVGMDAWKKQGKLTEEMLDNAIEQIESSPEDTVKDLIFMREIVRDNILEPMIGYDEAGSLALLDDKGRGVARLKPDDFFHAFGWITGQEGYRDNLERFRSRRERRAAKSGARRKKSGLASQLVS